MNKPTIREIAHRGEAFTICTSDGQKHYVPHPDFIAIGGEKDEVIIVFKEAGGFSFIDVFNITSVEVVKKSA